MMNEICQVIQEQQFSECRVLILSGDGPAFCSGLDLGEAAEADVVADHIERLFTVLYNTPLVTIALLHGDALAAGAGIASACDLVLTVPAARIGFPEVKRGLVAAMVAALLIRRIAVGGMRELLLTGEAVSGERAVELGLANRCVDEQSLRDEGLKLAKTILQGAPEAVKATKRLIGQLPSGDFIQDLRNGKTAYLEARKTDEAREGIASFLEKRTPDWC
jgi:methylglutaconyl-CoA hydratase